MNKNSDDISQEIFEEVDRFVTGKMNEKERRLFESRLEFDNELAQNVEVHRKLVLAVEEFSIREKFSAIHSKFFKSGSNSNRNLLVRLSAKTLLWAASVLVLIAIGSYFLFFQKSANEQIFYANFNPDPGLPTVMGSSNNYEFYDAMIDYKRGNYETAIQKWEQLSVEKPQNDTLNYFLGVAYLAKENANKAIEYLTKAQEKSNSIFINETYFYLGLAYLKHNDLEKSVENLKQSDFGNSQQIVCKINSLK